MSLSDVWVTFVDEVRKGIGPLVKSLQSGITNQAVQDANAFVSSTEEKLKRWGDLLAEGKIEKADFEILVESQADLAKLHALQSIGLAKEQLERFRTGLISLIINSAFAALGIGTSGLAP